MVDASTSARYGTANVFALADGDAGVEQTIEVMRRLVIDGRSDPNIRHAAGTIIRALDPRDIAGQARTIFEWVRENIRFVRDPAATELLQTPSITLRLGFGDCDDMSTLIASMLESVGIAAEFQTVGLASAEFDHVFVNAIINGARVPMDVARLDPQFGVTNTNVFRSHTWPIDPDDPAASPDASMGTITNTSGKLFRTTFPRRRLNGDVSTLGQEGILASITQAQMDAGAAGFDPSTWSGDYLDLTPDQQTQLIIWQAQNNPDVTVRATAGAILGGNAAAVPQGLTAQQIAQMITTGGAAAANVIRAINTPTSPYYNPQSQYYGANLAKTSFGGGFNLSGISINTILLALGAVLVLKR